jgi:Bax protein
MSRRTPPTAPKTGFDRGAAAFLAVWVVALFAVAALHPPAPPSGPSQEKAIPNAPKRDDNTTQLAKVTEPSVPPRGERWAEPGGVVSAGSAHTLTALFTGMGYTLEGVREGGRLVPRVFTASLPPDLERVDSVETRKAVFLKAMLPLVLRVNERILLDRGRVLALREREQSGRGLTAGERAWLEDVSRRYVVDGLDFDRLLARVDVIPPSLALAQAAEESGWGTSRFAVEGNAAFGQWTFDSDNGIVPRERERGKSHLIRSYDHLLEGVWAYAVNLNTHPAYREFRKLRAERRRSGRELDGYELAGTLKRYAERGRAYVQSVRTIMRANRLRSLDRARLKGAVLANVLVADG